MFVSRLLYPIKTLGPGNRIVIWTSGCTKQCFNCASPELWNKNVGADIDNDVIVERIINVIKSNKVDGITFSGGDPLEQALDLLYIIKRIKKHINDILVYTGYTFDEISTAFDESTIMDFKKYISVLIDGRYIHELNDNKSCLRGSLNQKIFFWDKNKKGIYNDYIVNFGRKIETKISDNQVLIIGIPNKEEKHNEPDEK